VNVYVSFAPPSANPVLDVRTEEAHADGERLCEIPVHLALKMRDASIAFRNAKEELLSHLVKTGQWDESWPEAAG
jgi:hypothetical protein